MILAASLLYWSVISASSVLFSTASTIISVPFGRTPAGASALISIVSFLRFTIQLTSRAASSAGALPLLSDVPSVNMFSPDEKSTSLEPRSSDSLYVSSELSSDSKFTSVSKSSPVSSDVPTAAESSSTSTMSTMSSKELA